MRIFTKIALCASLLMPTALTAQTVSFWDNVQLFVPRTLTTSISGTYEGMGMAMYWMRASDKLDLNYDSTGTMKMEYSATADGEKVLLSEVPTVPAEDVEMGIMVIGGAASAEDDDPIGFPTNMNIFFSFIPLSEIAGDSDLANKFREPGFYTMTFPEGTFVVKNEDGSYTPVSGETIVFELTSEKPKEIDTSYTLDPVDGSDISELLHPVSGGKESLSITITFPNATSVTTIDNGSGAKITNGSHTYYKPFPSINKNSMVFTFIGAEWPDGAWNFSIPSGRIVVDPVDYKAYDIGDGNVPEINATFIVKRALSKIEVTPIDTADSYTAISIDGKIVLRNASADRLSSLDAGLYIINGKKVVIK